MSFTRRSFGQTASVLLGLGFLILLSVGITSLYLVRQTRQYADAITALQSARVATQQTLSQLQDAETGQRGFLLTNDPVYLKPFATSNEVLPGTLRDLGQRLAILPDGPAMLARLTDTIGRKIAELGETVRLQRQGRLNDALQIVRTDRGKNLMDQARTQINRITAEIDIRRAAERKALYARTEWLLVATWSALAMVLALAIAGAVVVIRYMREADAAQQVAKTANESLERRVAERTEALATANEEIQRFAYIVSHDLRAPLVNVMGFTAELDAALGNVRTLLTETKIRAPELVTEDARMAIEEDLPEALNFIRTSTQRMDRLINAILKLSREGRRTLTPERVNMTELLNGVAISLQHQLDDAAAEVTIKSPMPDIVSDRLVVEQVFGNLIDNAVKYLQSGRPGRIVVTGQTEGGMLRYEIADNGRGIDARDRERVFELFRRAGAQDRPGEGIGLAHVRALIRRLGGTIDFTSTLGQGTTFIVRLPRMLQPAAGADT